MDSKSLNELYELVIEAMEDGVWDWDVPTGKAFFTPRYYELLGYADGEFPATYEYWMSMVSPNDLERVKEELRIGVGSGKKFVVDVRLKKKDGSYGWYSTRGKTISKNEDGSTKRMVGTLTDILQRKKIEEELQQSKAEMQEKFDEARKLNELTVDRELKMVELKNRIKELESKLK